MIALGTHQPMSEEAICERLEISLEERRAKYGRVRVLQSRVGQPRRARTKSARSHARRHRANSPAGCFEMEVPVKVNAQIFDYDQVIIIGPVFPHEVVGFSGGNKYLFPGVGGPEVLNFFHWLGAVVTNPMIIGNKWTPVRRVVDRAGGDGAGAEAVPVHGRRITGSSPGFSSARRKARGMRRANSRGSCTSIQGPPFPHRALVRAEDV